MRLPPFNILRYPKIRVNETQVKNMWTLCGAHFVKYVFETFSFIQGNVIQCFSWSSETMAWVWTSLKFRWPFGRSSQLLSSCPTILEPSGLSLRYPNTSQTFESLLDSWNLKWLVNWKENCIRRYLILKNSRGQLISNIPLYGFDTKQEVLWFL